MGNRVLTCVYCGHEYPQETPSWGNDVLTDHIRECPKHPLRKAEADIELLRNALAGLIGVTDKAELEKMELAVRVLPVPETDRIVSLNAIHALQETLPNGSGSIPDRNAADVGREVPPVVGDLISELEAEFAHWTDERRKVERRDYPNIGTAICVAKANAYADAALRVRRSFGLAPPDACGFRRANTGADQPREPKANEG